MRLELSDEETALLDRILSGYLSDLRMEVAGTDSFKLRQELKHEEETIKKLLGDLQTPSP